MSCLGNSFLLQVMNTVLNSIYLVLTSVLSVYLELIFFLVLVWSEVGCPMLFFFPINSQLSQKLLLIYPTFSCPSPLLPLSHIEYLHVHRSFLWVLSFFHWPVCLWTYQYHIIFYKKLSHLPQERVLDILVFGFLIFKIRTWYWRISMTLSTSKRFILFYITVCCRIT